MPGPVQRVTLMEGSTQFTRFRLERDGKLRIDACNERCPQIYRMRVEIQSPDLPDLAITGGGAITAERFPAAARSRRGGRWWREDRPRAVDGINVSAAVNGGGDIFVRARATLAAAVNGGGTVRYVGHPEVSIAIRGGGNGPFASTELDDLRSPAIEPQADRQQRAEGVVAARARVEGVEEQLRLAVQSWRDRSMAWRSPFARRLEQRLALLRVGAERMVGDRDADPVGGRREVVAGVEQPVAAFLVGDERAFDQMALPIEVVAAARSGLRRPANARRRRSAARGSAWSSLRRMVLACRPNSASDGSHCVQLASAASISGCITKKRTIGRCALAQGTIAAANAAVLRSALRANSLSIRSG